MKKLNQYHHCRQGEKVEGEIEKMQITYICEKYLVLENGLREWKTIHNLSLNIVSTYKKKRRVEINLKMGQKVCPLDHDILDNFLQEEESFTLKTVMIFMAFVA